MSVSHNHERAEPASSGETVTAFIRAYERRDVEAALELVTDDFVFENVPMPESTIVRGKQQFRERMGGPLATAERVEWEILNQVDGGDVVMNERVDVFYFPEGLFARTRTVTRVVGVWVLRDGKIAVWRDYYDLKTGWLDQVGIDVAEFESRLVGPASEEPGKEVK
jgi:limonene-1,2-epoxide hydrolase